MNDGLNEEWISELHSTGVWTEPTFDSFEEAVSASSRSDRSARSRRENPQLKDVEILDYSLLLGSVDLLLSDGRVMHVFLDGDKVEWRYFPATGFRKAPRIYADRVRFHLPRSEPYWWEPDTLLAARLGIKGLFLGPALTFLTIEMKGREELMFTKTVLRDGREILHFDPE